LQKYYLEKIWDPVTRVWHWVLALVVSLGWYFGEFMSFSTIQWHFYCGYTILTLMLLRIVWGFVGPRPIRFRSLLASPANLLAYARGVGSRRPSGTHGHNPLGSLFVIAIILLLTTQSTIGLFIESEDFFESAPLSHLVSESTGWQLIWLHKLLPNFILALVSLHVVAILFYLFWKKENLIVPMFTGRKWVKKVDGKIDSDSY
jgi:cytochrome b